jgi:D-serine deaminase-like pyridoxal phosphate-dependent protein
MGALLAGAGFRLLEEMDSSEESGTWFRQAAAKMEASGPPPISLRMFLGGDHPEMTLNQVRNLAERRIRTVTYICRRLP